MADWLNNLISRLRQQKGMATLIWVVILFVVLGIGVLMGSPFGRMEETAANAPAFSSSGQLISVFLKWIAVIGLMYVAFIFLRRWQGNISGNLPKQISVLERLSLSQKQAILLVRVGNRKLLLGATDQNISLITELKEGDELDPQALSQDTITGTKEEKGFNSVLQNTMEGNLGSFFGSQSQRKENSKKN